jgi:hypothetical protein
MNAALVRLLARAAFMHRADPSGMYQSHRVSMMHECSPGELLAGICKRRRKRRKNYALTGNRTPAARVADDDANDYTTGLLVIPRA